MTRAINTAHHDNHYDLETVNFYRNRYGIQYPSQWWRHATHWWRNYPSAPIVFRSAGDAWEGGITLTNCFVREEKDVAAIVLAADGNPGAGEQAMGWSDVRGDITVANRYGARVDIRTPVKNVSLQLNGKLVATGGRP